MASRHIPMLMESSLSMLSQEIVSCEASFLPLACLRALLLGGTSFLSCWAPAPYAPCSAQSRLHPLLLTQSPFLIWTPPQPECQTVTKGAIYYYLLAFKIKVIIQSSNKCALTFCTNVTTIHTLPYMMSLTKCFPYIFTNLFCIFV